MTREPWEDRLDEQVSEQIEAYAGMVTPDQVVQACAEAWSPTPPVRYVAGEDIAVDESAVVGAVMGLVWRAGDGSEVDFQTADGIAAGSECWADHRGRLWATERAARDAQRGRVKVKAAGVRGGSNELAEDVGWAASRFWATFREEPWLDRCSGEWDREGGARINVWLKPCAGGTVPPRHITGWENYPVVWFAAEATASETQTDRVPPRFVLAGEIGKGDFGHVGEDGLIHPTSVFRATVHVNYGAGERMVAGQTCWLDKAGWLWPTAGKAEARSGA